MAAKRSEGARWTEVFSRKTLERGLACFNQGRVQDLDIDEEIGLMSAVVQGPVDDPYEVDIDLVPNGRAFAYDGSCCDCSKVVNCEHAAAALYAAEAARPDLFGRCPPKRAQGTDGLPALSGAVRDWLLRVQQAAGPTGGSEADRPAQDRLIYVLSVEILTGRQGRRLKVACFKSRPLQNGGNGRQQRFVMNNALNMPPARFVQPVDTRIALLVTRGQRKGYLAYAHDALLEGAEGAEVLELLLQTGRCYWKDRNSTPLQAGEPRPGEPDWMRDAEGCLHPTFKTSIPASEIFPLAPPWYRDAASGTCGPVQLKMTLEAAQAWLDGPPIAPRETPALAQAFQEQAPSLPPPESIEVIRPDPVRPTPCFNVATRKVNWWELPGGFGQAGVDGIPVHYGKLSFDYHGLPVKAHSQAATLERFDGEKLTVIPRDMEAEHEAVELLQANGFVPDQDFFRHYRHEKMADSFILPPDKSNEWLRCGRTILPKLREAGWRIELDRSFECDIVEVTGWYAEANEDGAANWFDVELGVQVGKKKINLLPILLEALRTQGDQFAPEKLNALHPDRLLPIRLPDGRVLPFPAGRLREILSVLVELFDPQSLGKRGRLKLPRLRAAELAGLGGKDSWQWFGGETLRDLAKKLKNFQGIARVQVPSGLQAQLRHYQEDGLNWLQFLRAYDLAGILADDMGLGKTVQALAHLLIEKEAGRLDRPAMVVAPTSLMVNWRQEAERFAPSLRTLVLHGPDRKARFADIPDHDLVLTTYPLLPRDAEYLLAVDFHTVILDEAQFIKNPKAQWTQVVCQLQARHRLCLTGTPMENHLGELWSLFNFLLPGFLGDETRFRALFRNPIEKANNQDRRQSLARRVAPFLLRRRKEEVVKELPPKTEIAQNVELSGGQRDLYESIRLAMHQRVREEVQKKGMSRSHIIILDALLKLRQVCCDPRLLSLESARRVHESAKLELLMDLVPEMLAEGRRILLFSQFASMLELIEKRLAAQELAWVKLTGSTTDRATPVNRFQNGEVPLFLISLKAGGTGLNLTAADTVIHYDPWWNPAVEDQATDRAHRIGQDKPVFVYKLLTVGTVEEKILAMQARKRELVEGLLNEGAGRRLEISAQDLEYLFAPLI